MAMINRLHAFLHSPEAGWDPVPETHVRKYADAEFRAGADGALVDQLDSWIGGLAGKEVLDLGGGPGHYSLEFARRGANVTWFDVSRGYRRYAEEKCLAREVSVRFSTGYLDHAEKILGRTYDLVFNRLCWNYSFNDATFAHMVYRLASPGGVIYIDTAHSASWRARGSSSVRLRTWVNDAFRLKVGHPYPPKGRIPLLLMKHPLRKMSVNYASPDNERVMLQKQ